MFIPALLDSATKCKNSSHEKDEEMSNIKTTEEENKDEGSQLLRKRTGQEGDSMGYTQGKGPIRKQV